MTLFVWVNAEFFQGYYRISLIEGYLQLVKTSVQQSSLTVCSIFVNPIQFNDPLDYKKYPDRREADIPLLVRAGADLLF